MMKFKSWLFGVRVILDADGTYDAETHGKNPKNL